MKATKLFLILLSISFSYNIYSQNAYYDALFLRKYAKIDSRGLITLKPLHDQDINAYIKERDSILSVLLKYFPPGDSADDVDYTGNKFFVNKIILAGATLSDAPPPSITEDINSAVSAIGGLNVTTIADGLAKFIVKRTKEELSIEFFSKFRKTINENPDLVTLFPQTVRVLNSIDEDIYMYKAYIQTLRKSFETDLSSLPENLPLIIDNHQAFFDAMPELKASLTSSFYIAQSIQEGQHPGKIIENFPDYYWAAPSINKNYQATFKTLKLFNKSLKNTATDDDKTYWVPFSDISKMSDDEIILRLYLGLMVQQAKKDDIIFYAGETPKPFSDIINASAEAQSDYSQYKIFLSEMGLKTQSIENKIKALKTVETDSLRFENYYNLISGTIDLMKTIGKARQLPHFNTFVTFNIRTETKEYFDMAQVAAEIGISINRRNYAAAVSNAVYICDLIFSQKNLTATNTAARPDTAGMFKYGTFMAALVEAENSDEVEAAIETFALPSGSARIKRETNFNVSVNAYCGFFIGSEKIEDIDQGYKLNSYGVTAPVGISVSFGKQKWYPLSSYYKYDGHWAKTLFFSIVDLGAITAFRFSDNTTESVPTIELKDIISPGLFYSLGIPNSPISLNFGYQAGPLLRKVNAAENTYGQSYSRLSFSIVVDLPLLNLYTSNKK